MPTDIPSSSWLFPTTDFFDDISWTQRWATLLTWLDSYNAPNRQAIVCFLQLELQDVPEHTLQAVLSDFFAQVDLAKQKFDAVSRSKTDSQWNIEYHAKQAMHEVQLGIDLLIKQDAPSTDPTRRDICKRLFARMVGTTQNSEKVSGLRIQQEVETALRKISDLSSLTSPSPSYQKGSRKAVDIALTLVREFQDKHEYRDRLLAFKRKRRALLTELTLVTRRGRANGSQEVILTQYPEIGQLNSELLSLADLLSGFAQRRADECQKFYEYLLINRKGLSQCLDLATKGQGRRIVDDLINKLWGLVSFSRREAHFWKSLGRDPFPWPHLKPIYDSALCKLQNPAAPEQSVHECSSAASENNKLLQAQHVAEAVQGVSNSYIKILTLQDGHIRKQLVKTQPRMNSLVNKTIGYFEHVVSQSAAQPSVNVAMSVATNALSIANSWKGLYNKVNLIVHVFGDFLFCKMKVTASASSKELGLKPCANDDGIISKNLHPFLSDLEMCILDLKKQYSSLSECFLNMKLVLPDLDSFA